MPFALVAQAAVNVNFDFSNHDSLINGKYTSDPITVDGLTLTIATSDNWSGSNGLAASGSGLTVVAEDNRVLTFSFNKQVTISGFNTMAVGNPAGDEELRLSWGISGEYTETNYVNSQLRITTLSTPITLAAGEKLTITSYNPVWQDVINMESLQVTVVPEPAVYGLGLGLLTLGVVVLRRRRKACG